MLAIRRFLRFLRRAGEAGGGPSHRVYAGHTQKVVFGDSLSKFLLAPKIFALIPCFHLCGIKNKLPSEAFFSCTSSFFLLPVLVI
jgi:hypothetical protein